MNPTILKGRLKGDMVTTLSSKISLLSFPSQLEDANEMWVNMAKTIRKVAKETLGVSSGKPKVFKESWWWNDEVEKKIKDKNRRFKDKNDVKVCGNYRGIKILSHTVKLWERVVERRIRQEPVIRENQFGFMPGRSTIEAIHVLRRLMEKYRERKKDLHMVFIELEKAYDSISRCVIWDSLKARGISSVYIEAIRDMYDRVSTNIQTPVQIT